MEAGFISVFYSMIVAYTAFGGIIACVPGTPELSQYDWVYSAAWQATMKVEIWLDKTWFIGTTWICSFYYNYTVGGWQPTVMDYEFKIGFKVGPVSCYIDHWCGHPVLCYSAYYWQNTVLFEGGSTQLCISLSGWF